MSRKSGCGTDGTGKAARVLGGHAHTASPESSRSRRVKKPSLAAGGWALRGGQAICCSLSQSLFQVCEVLFDAGKQLCLIACFRFVARLAHIEQRVLSIARPRIGGAKRVEIRWSACVIRREDFPKFLDGLRVLPLVCINLPDMEVRKAEVGPVFNRFPVICKRLIKMALNSK